MGTTTILRAVTVAGFAISSGLLCFGALSADSWRESYVFLPRERAVEDAVRQVAERQRSLHETTGAFVNFAHSDVEADTGPIGLPWNNFPVSEFYFDAMALDTGNIRLRALPRPDAIRRLDVRARIFVSEISPEGDVVQSGWLPPASVNP